MADMGHTERHQKSKTTVCKGGMTGDEMECEKGKEMGAEVSAPP